MQLCMYYLSDSKCLCSWDVGLLQFASCSLRSLSYLVCPGKWPFSRSYLVSHKLLSNVGDRVWPVKGLASSILTMTVAPSLHHSSIMQWKPHRCIRFWDYSLWIIGCRLKCNSFNSAPHTQELDGTLTGVVSFYSIFSRLLNQPVHTGVRAAHLLFVISTATNLVDLMKDTLILAKSVSFLMMEHNVSFKMESHYLFCPVSRKVVTFSQLTTWWITAVF